MSDPWDLDAPPRALRPLLSAAELAYKGGLAVRRALYAAGVAKTGAAPCPVISVGNLTVGGNGKTPMVLLLAERLRAAGRRPAIVSRGYGGTHRDGVHRVHPHTSAIEAGDEPVLLARRTGLPVYVAPARVEGAREAAAQGADVILLDDGFQHWALGRDLDLVLLDAARPFGGGHLLPAGRLREPRAALARADVVVAHRGDAAAPAPVTGLRADVEVAIRPRALATVAGAEVPLSELAGRDVALAAAIARPERFEATVAGLGARVAERLWVRDHEMIDVAMLRALGRRHGRVVITEKDAARLPTDGLDDLPLWVLTIEMVILAGEAALDAAVARALGGEGAGAPKARAPR